MVEYRKNGKENGFMVSIRDVAKEAGVAISTVSKVLNDYPNITEATREKVNRAIRELNYVPNSIAAALSSKHSGRTALLMDPTRQTQAADEVCMQYLLGALDCGRELNMDVVTVFFSMLEGMSSDDIARYLRAQGVQAVIIFGLTQEDKVIRSFIQEEEFYTVVVDAPFVGRAVTSVSVDNEKAQYDVAYKTISDNVSKLPPEQKSQSVLYIAGSGSSYVTAERTKGMKKAAEELGVSLSIRYGDFSELKARGIAMVTGKDKDITVCASDVMAIGAMKAYQELDIFHPVCGFDGIALMGYAGEGMNTVRQDFYDIAGTSVREAKRLMDGEEGRQVVMPHSIVTLGYMDVIK